MKKLMIAATAAMAGATTFGALCDLEAAGPDSCSVYNIKFTFKTLAAKTACAQGARWLVTEQFPGVPNAVWYRNANADTAAAARAGLRAVAPADYVATGLLPCATSVRAIQNAALRQVFWMDNATRKFEGIAWQCRAACFEAGLDDCDPNNNGRLNYVLWEPKNRLAISFPVFQIRFGETDNPVTRFTGTTDTWYFSRDAQREMFIGRYGNKAQKVAAYWNLRRLLHAQSIQAAGFGTYDVRNLRTKSISGNAVGMIMPISVSGSDACGNRNRIFCALGFMCVEWMDWCCDGCYAGVELVPASGTWSLKYNASATKRANDNRATLASFVPDYMFYRHADWARARNADPWLHTDNCYWWSRNMVTLFYKGHGRDDGAIQLSDDFILDSLAEAACNVIDITFDGVTAVKEVTEQDEDGQDVTVTKTVWTYGSETKTITEEDEETGEEVTKEVVVAREYEIGADGVVVLPEDMSSFATLPRVTEDDEEEDEEEDDE